MSNVIEPTATTAIATGPPQPASARAPRARQISDYVLLSQQVQAAGLMRRRYGYYWSKLGAIAVIFPAAVLAFLWIGDTWWQMFVAAGFALILTQTAFLGHDAAHRQIFKSGQWNDWTSVIIANLFVGMSYGWWQNKHSRHHGNPNKEGSDPDIEFPPLALTPAQARSPHNLLERWFLARQGWLFFPMLPLEGVSLHLSGLRRLIEPEPIPRRWVELSLITARLGAYVTMLFLVLSPDKAGVFLAIQLGIFGIYMGGSFAPNHKGMPIIAAGLRLDFVRRQVLTSRNIHGSLALDVAMGGLNYQIEHHLFPSMARPSLRRAQPIVEAFCVEHGVHYTSTTFRHSYAIVVRYLNRVGIGARDPFECPLLVQRQLGSRPES
ncbi:MAG TPA: acyl-CoA desaturase [Microbacteriaceae bacterium]